MSIYGTTREHGIGRSVPAIASGVPEIRCGVPGIGCGVAEIGRGVPGIGYSVPEIGCGVPEIGCGVPEIGCGVPGVGCSVPETGCGVPESVRISCNRKHKNPHWKFCGFAVLAKNAFFGTCGFAVTQNIQILMIGFMMIGLACRYILANPPAQPYQQFFLKCTCGGVHRYILDSII